MRESGFSDNSLMLTGASAGAFASRAPHQADNQDFEAVVKLASVTELLIGEGQQTPVSIAFFTYSCA